MHLVCVYNIFLSDLFGMSWFVNLISRHKHEIQFLITRNFASCPEQRKEWLSVTRLPPFYRDYDYAFDASKYAKKEKEKEKERGKERQGNKMFLTRYRNRKNCTTIIWLQGHGIVLSGCHQPTKQHRPLLPTDKRRRLEMARILLSHTQVGGGYSCISTVLQL